MARHKNSNWNLPEGTVNSNGSRTHSWDSIHSALLMDIRDELMEVIGNAGIERVQPSQIKFQLYENEIEAIADAILERFCLRNHREGNDGTPQNPKFVCRDCGRTREVESER